MCSWIPFQRMSFYTYCTMHAFFLTRGLCFEQRQITPMSNCSPFGLAAGQGLLHDTWRWCTISSALLFLPAFLAVAEPSRFNATMMVISGCLSKRLSTRADGRVLIQFASWTCVSQPRTAPANMFRVWSRVCEIIVPGPSRHVCRHYFRYQFACYGDGCNPILQRSRKAISLIW